MTMPQILKNFLNSEKAVASAVPLIIATVFVFTGRITEQQWMNFAMAITGIYTAGKTAHGVASEVSGAKKAKSELAELKDKVSSNDAVADSALDAKFEEKSDA